MTGEFPIDAEHLRQVLCAGGRAPSKHNTQPWRFQPTRDAIDIWAERTWRLPASDPDDRELRLACGAALFNIRTALTYFGYAPQTELLPDPTQPDLLARVGVRDGVPGAPPPAVTGLFRAVWRRSTNRKPFRAEDVPAVTRRALRQTAEAEGARLILVEDPALRAALRGLVRTAHHHQESNPACRAELAEWTGHPESSGDGVPRHLAGPRPEPQDEWAMRDFTGGTAESRPPGKDFEPRPTIAVLISTGDYPVHQVQAGQALQHVLLTATVAGLACSYLNQPVEVPTCRRELRDLLGGTGWPQVVLRLGFGGPTPPSPRRALDDIGTLGG
ncbi:MAG TPA: nitroreductase family protein [Pseudonocardiaceae bacterium]